MNLELLDPFGRHVPDRVDATLSIPVVGNEAGTAAAASGAAWNRRGTYLAVSYEPGSTTTGTTTGGVAIFSWLSRSLVAWYPPPVILASDDDTSGTDTTTTKQKKIPLAGWGGRQHPLTWARRSRTLLCGGTSAAALIDVTHPWGAQRATAMVRHRPKHGAVDPDQEADEAPPKTTPTKRASSSHAMTNQDDTTMPNVVPPLHTYAQTKDTPFCDDDQEDDTTHQATTTTSKTNDRLQLVTYSRQLPVRWVSPTTTSPTTVSHKKGRRSSWSKSHKTAATTTTTDNHHATPPWIPPTRGIRYPSVVWSFTDKPPAEGDHPASSSSSRSTTAWSTWQLHPTVAHAGIATLPQSTSFRQVLVAFYIRPAAFYANHETETTAPEEYVHVLPLHEEYNIKGAVLSPLGQELYAVTDEGTILAWKDLHDTFWQSIASAPPPVRPTVVVSVMGQPSFTQCHLLRHDGGQWLCVNAKDGALRLIPTTTVWSTTSSSGNTAIQPHTTCQDVVNRVKFTCLDVSGDGEYIVGGVNNSGKENGYELYLWSTATGQLVDTLQGTAQVRLHDVAWHPNRAFVAACTSDGLVDIWGPRLNWTAFAPDFQALPRNVEYVEQEDEFDVRPDGTFVTETATDGVGSSSAVVDVRHIVPIPAFASDSEDETEIFDFSPRLSAAVKQSQRFVAKTSDKVGDE